MAAETIFSSNVSNAEGMIALISVDKSGKGTTFRQLTYALAELGFNVLGVPFPLYNYIDGQLIEMGLSHRGIAKNAKNHVSLDDVGIDKTFFLHTYASNRLRALPVIREYQKKGYVIVTKRSSKATHVAYQTGLNGFPEEKVMALDAFFPDPTILVNLLSKRQSMVNFSKKGSSILDEFESKPQDRVVALQKKFTESPGLVGAQFGFFVPSGESPVRLKTILSGVLPLLERKGFKKNASRGDLKIFGLEEPLYKYREEDGFNHFLKDYDAHKFVNSVMGEDHWEICSDLSSVKRYEKLFTHVFTGEKDPYPFSVQEEVNVVVDGFRN